jgi:hypothetical protein
VQGDVDRVGALELDRGKVLVEEGFKEDDFFSGIDVRDERGVSACMSAPSASPTHPSIYHPCPLYPSHICKLLKALGR